MLAGLLFLVTGCFQDLLPGEWVVPGEVPAQVFAGESGERLGSAVAIGEGGNLLIGGAGLGQVHQEPSGLVCVGFEGLGNWTWWDGDLPYAAAARQGVFRVDGPVAVPTIAVDDAITFAAGPMEEGFTVISVSPGGLAAWRIDEKVAFLEREGIRRAAVGQDRVLALANAPVGCEVLAWDPGDGSIASLGMAGCDGTVFEVEGVAWWTDTQSGDSLGRGWVRSEAGDEIEGEPGDHMGRTLSRTHAAGVFNKNIVPARTRIVALDGSGTLAVERGVEDRAITLDAADGLLAVGIPFWPDPVADAGRVLLVDLEDLESVR